MNKPCLLDTNVLVRFFTGEPPDMAERARAIVAQADAGKLRLEIPPLIVAGASPRWSRKSYPTPWNAIAP